jgi:hypothetical protein
MVLRQAPCVPANSVPGVRRRAVPSSFVLCGKATPVQGYVARPRRGQVRLCGRQPIS